MVSRPLSIAIRDMLFAHWPINPEHLQPHVPDILTLDTFDGDAWVGILPHYVPEIKVRSFGGGNSFSRLNFRTYVRRNGEPGVYFLNLYADSRVSGLVGREIFGFPYNHAKMSINRSGDGIQFRCQPTDRGAESGKFDVVYRPTDESFQAESGSIEDFLIERSRYYAPRKEKPGPTGNEIPFCGRTLHVGEIDREPWELHSAQASIRTNTLFTANGIEPPVADPLFHYSRRFDAKFGLPRSEDV
jgi:uncharacterized protein YqjF (DUF2071 family)